MLSHQSLLHTVWGTGYHEEVDYIRVYLHTLRLKLEDDPRHPTYLETITGGRILVPPTMHSHFFWLIQYGRAYDTEFRHL
ncbi:hypothetical protein KSC_034790 [Ktedonobacter sp. SOSP1-52]|nr:hypothetical protein KSC_034790 [Ktedonobacter sp. SOSP1-52]